MKTIFMTVFDGAVSKNMLRTDVLKILARECRVVLFVSPLKYDYHVKHFASEHVIIEKTPPATSPYLESKLNLFSLNNLHTNTIRIKIHHNYFDEGGLLSKYLKLALWHIGRFQILHRALRFLYLRTPDYSFDTFFEKYNPALVFAPNIIANEDFRMIKAARKRGIVSVGMPKGWDNLSAKTFFLIFPNYLLLQNETMRREAIEHYNFPPDRIFVVGFPNFDIYAHRECLVSREEFYSSLGLDPNKTIILYAVAGDALAPHDEEVFNHLVEELEKRPELKSKVQIHVRPHPKYVFRKKVLKTADYIVMDDPGVKITEKRSSWEFLDKDIVHLMNSLYHADMLICTLSTLSIESAIFNVPIISVAYDGDLPLNYYMSVRRYYDYSHMRPLVESGAITVAHDRNELVNAVETYVEDATLHMSGRKNAVDLYVGECDGKAGERIAHHILAALKREHTL